MQPLAKRRELKASSVEHTMQDMWFAQEGWFVCLVLECLSNSQILCVLVPMFFKPKTTGNVERSSSLQLHLLGKLPHFQYIQEGPFAVVLNLFTSLKRFCQDNSAVFERLHVTLREVVECRRFRDLALLLAECDVQHHSTMVTMLDSRVVPEVEEIVAGMVEAFASPGRIVDGMQKEGKDLHDLGCKHKGLPERIPLAGQMVSFVGAYLPFYGLYAYNHRDSDDDVEDACSAWCGFMNLLFAGVLTLAAFPFVQKQHFSHPSGGYMGMGLGADAAMGLHRPSFSLRMLVDNVLLQVKVRHWIVLHELHGLGIVPNPPNPWPKIPHQVNKEDLMTASLMARVDTRPWNSTLDDKGSWSSGLTDEGAGLFV